jgi:hypothetical protein
VAAKLPRSPRSGKLRSRHAPPGKSPQGQNSGVQEYTREALTRISHRLSAAARDKAASTSLRLVTVLDVLSKYASAC